MDVGGSSLLDLESPSGPAEVPEPALVIVVALATIAITTIARYNALAAIAIATIATITIVY